MKNKKKIIFVIIVAVVIVLVVGAVIFFKSKGNSNKGGEEDETVEISNDESALQNFYDEISQKTEYTYKEVLDKNNSTTIVVKGDLGYKEDIRNGKVSKYLVKDNNLYYINVEEKIYYEYSNNDSILSEVKNKYNTILNMSRNVGVEKVEGKKYQYEEVADYQDFLMNYSLQTGDAQTANAQNFKTRIYLKDNIVKYLKTIIGDKEEILKVSISYKDVDFSYFNVLDNYEKAE